jgi:hypothetical protein
MGKTIRIKVDDSLKEVLGKIQREVADEMKQKYKLKSITIHGTLASQILATKASGKTVLNFEIDKIGLNAGILRLIY